METVTVAVIGNGPSGILMSLLLSGADLDMKYGPYGSDLASGKKLTGRALLLPEGMKLMERIYS